MASQGVPVRGTCKLGHVTQETALPGRVTWRGQCSAQGCEHHITARRVPRDNPPAAAPPTAHDAPFIRLDSYATLPDHGPEHGVSVEPGSEPGGGDSAGPAVAPTAAVDDRQPDPISAGEPGGGDAPATRPDRQQARHPIYG